MDESFVFDQRSVADFRRFLSQLFGGFLSKVCLISDMCRFFAVSCQPLAK